MMMLGICELLSQFGMNNTSETKFESGFFDSFPH